MTHEHDNNRRGWTGVDFDGTLAEYTCWVSPTHVGRPIAPMVERVKRWLAEGREVRIFTARIWPLIEPITPELFLDADLAPTDRGVQAIAAALAIRSWCQEHIGQVLTITCVKDFAMHELYDDRAVQVEKNTGRLVGYSTREPLVDQQLSILVPIEPTDAMLEAGTLAHEQSVCDDLEGPVHDAWTAMLRASVAGKNTEGTPA